MQRTLRKIKSRLPEKSDKKLYPTGSCPGKFHGNTKVYRLSTNYVDDIQVDGVPMISPLSPALANIFTVKLEMSVIPNPNNRV